MLTPVRLYVWFVACLLLPAVLSAQSPSLADARLIAGRCLIDTSGELSIRDVLARQDWITPAASDRIELTNYYVWTRLELDNPTDRSVSELLLLNRDADSAWVYTQRYGADSAEYLGLRTATGGKTRYTSLLPATYQVSLRPRDSITVVARLHFRDSWPLATVAAATRHEVSAVINAQLATTAWHFFYTGLMFSVSLLSLFVYVMFRDRSLLYFAGVTLSFGAYFLVINTMTDVLGLPSPVSAGTGSLQVVISALVVTMSTFVARFIRLPLRYPRYHRFYWLIAVLTVAAQFVPYLVGWHLLTIILLANLMLLAWVVAVLAPILVLSQRGDVPARQLALSSVMLALPAIAYLSQLMLTSALNNWLQYCLQFGSLSFTAILVRALARQIRDMRSTTQRLREQTELKARFFANISHEFRTPLTLIMSPLEQLLEHHPPGGEGNDHELLTLAHVNAKRQLDLVNRILQLSRLEADAASLNTGVIDVARLAKSTLVTFTHLAEQRGITLHCAAPAEPLLARLDAQKIEDILLNLIANAVKFTPAGGAVTLTVGVGERDSTVVLKVADTGVGIAEDELPTIFERFFRTPEAEDGVEGTGLGLSLVRELVRLHGGTVRVASTVGEGTTFVIELPDAVVTEVDYALQQSEVVGSASDASMVSLPGDSVTGVEKPLVLLVEDNAALRELLRLTLRQDYRTAEATGGRQGQAYAKQLHPDLIISDVAMPDMDGYGLVEAVKQDVEVSHIPIILLTARAASEDRISGLRVGADAYLTKPFNHNELLARVKNLLESRKLLRQRYATSIALKPAEVTTTPADSAFLQQCMQVVEDHLSEEKFRVADLAGAVNMSTASLNRKLRSLLDQSTNQFIQSVRLQRAHDLLTTSAATVAEVGHATGFSSTTYFVKVYRERYGETPGSVLRGV